MICTKLAFHLQVFVLSQMRMTLFKAKRAVVYASGAVVHAAYDSRLLCYS